MRNSCLSLALLVPLALAQTDSAVTREGRFWVQTTAGSLPSGTGLLRIEAGGAVTVRGEDRGDVGYTLRKRAAARDALGGIVVRSKREGEWATLEIAAPSSMSSLEVRVPRGLRRVSVRTRSDAIEVYDIQGQVEAEAGGGRIHVDRVGGDVAVRTAGGQIWLGEVGGSVRCTSAGGGITARSIGGGAELATQGGEIAITEVKGAVRASTGGGSIHVERAGQGATLMTAGGLIDVGQAGGPVVAQSGAGSIKVGAAANVRCSSANGAIRLASVSGEVRATTALGGIVAELAPGATIQDSRITAVMGDITVYIPSNLAVTVQAISSGGAANRIVSDFPGIQPRPVYGARVEAGGAVNGGGPVLQITTSGGTVYLRRR